MSLDLYLKAIVDLGGEEPWEGKIWEGNLTYNLSPMLDAAGGYWELICRQSQGKLGQDILPAVDALLAELRRDPAKYQAMNPSNGWGHYEGAVEFLTSLQFAIRQHPRAVVDSWR
jgi:hypothetical protein